MPLKLNIGLARKVGESNYGSRGASINLEMEVESALISDSARLQERIRQVFHQIRDSLAEELNGRSPSGTGNGEAHPPPNGNGNGHANGHHSSGNGHGNGHQNGNGHGPRPATQSQIKAIYSIARNRRLDLVHMLRPFQTDRPEDLSITQASQLIDDLKSSSTAKGN